MTRVARQLIMRIRLISCAVLFLASTLPSSARSQDDISPRDTPARHDWEQFYFWSFNAAARAAGLEPLWVSRLPAGSREVRIWTQLEIAVPKELYRFVDRGGQVTGELIYYWDAPPPDSAEGERPGETLHDLLVYGLAGRCGDFAVVEATAVCRARFRRPPPWNQVLREAESHGLWSIPDPSVFPPDSIMSLDGWTIAVELRDSSGYRTYLYNNPNLHRWPTSPQVLSIARTLSGIDTLLAPAEATRRYRGVTTGESRSAFRACGETVDWEFQAGLDPFARHGPAETRAMVQAARAAATRPERPELYYIEVVGELSPEWHARERGSRFERVLEVYTLSVVRPATGTDCDNP